MTTIRKLQIRGVRSFSPNQDSVIDFFKPLTIIVGQNGCGKTTLIECLKFATTGEVPPGTGRGQAFVHDPKIADEREVKAKVILQFKDVRGKPMRVIRSLQLTQLASGKQTFKTLDSSVSTRNSAGKTVTQSYRCADIDKLVPERMGVSKSILEHVIFCHQEDSNWPLSDSATLKKKFDDIFASTGYTKALKSMKELRKDKGVEVRQANLRLETCKVKRDQVNEKRNYIKDRLAFIEDVTELLKATEQELESAMTQQTKAQKIKDRYHTRIAEVQRLQSVLAEQEKSLALFYHDLQEEYTETDAELEHLSKSFNEDLENLRRDKQSHSSQMETVGREYARCTENVNKYSVEVATVESQIDAFRIRRKERDEAIKRFSEGHDELAHFHSSGDLTPSSVSEFFDTCEQRSRSQQSTLDSVSRKESDRNNALQQKESVVSSRQAQLKEQIRVAESARRDAETQESKFERELRENKAAVSSLKSLEKTVQQAKEELEMMKKSMDPEATSEEIKKGEAERERWDSKLTEARSLLEVAKSREQRCSMVEVTRKRADTQRSSVTQRLARHLKDLQKVIGGSPSLQAGDLSPALSKAITRLQREVNSRRAQLETHRHSASKAAGHVHSLTALVAKLEQTLAACENDLSVIGEQEKSVPELIADAEKNLQRRQKDVTMATSGRLMYKLFSKKGSANEACPLCERGFESQKCLDAFIEKLDDIRNNKLPATQRAHEAKLVESKELYDSLSKLRPVWDNAERVRAELNEAKAELKNGRENTKKQEAASAKLSSALKSEDDLLSLGLRLKSEADHIDNAHRECEALFVEVSRDQKALDEESRGALSSTDVNVKCEEYRRQSEAARDNTSSLRLARDTARSDISSREANMFEMQQRLATATKASSAVISLEDRLKELRQRKQTFSSNGAKASKDLDAVLVEIAEVRAERERVENEGRREIAEIRQRLNDFTNEVSRLRNLENELSRRPLSELEELMSTHRADLDEAKSTLNETTKRHAKIKADVRRVEKELSDQEHTRRTIDANFKYRKLKRENATFKEEVAVKEEGIRGVRVNDIDADLEDAASKVQRLRSKRDKNGAMRQVFRQEIARTKEELRSADLVGVDEEYDKTLISAKTTEMAIQDLGRYLTALDKALTKYHSLKMEEINKIIAELWQTTYKGSDIDTVRIRTDLEEARANKTYNYRLVMMKGDTELDMRGRCSAGQKVLASLIIRLALAETFCINCGILALDEPTTNLDRFNVLGLAHALVEIIESRRHQSNFQLVVITHDEEFVQHLGRSDYADYYWRVSKNESGHSMVERQDIRDLE